MTSACLLPVPQTSHAGFGLDPGSGRMQIICDCECSEQVIQHPLARAACHYGLLLIYRGFSGGNDRSITCYVRILQNYYEMARMEQRCVLWPYQEMKCLQFWFRNKKTRPAENRCMQWFLKWMNQFKHNLILCFREKGKTILASNSFVCFGSHGMHIVYPMETMQSTMQNIAQLHQIHLQGFPNSEDLNHSQILTEGIIGGIEDVILFCVP